MALNSVCVLTMSLSAIFAFHPLAPQGFGGGGGLGGGGMDAPATDEPEPNAPAGSTSGAAAPAEAKESDTPVEPPIPVEKGWLEKLRQPDRAALEAVVGWQFTLPGSSVKWIGGAAPEKWTGRVIVVQSFNPKGGKWKAELAKSQQALSSLKDQAILIGLVTPEGAERFTAKLAEQVAPTVVAVDSTGSWCDSLGVYKAPVNLVIGKDGNIRYAGLTSEGLSAVAQALADESLSPSAGPIRRKTASTSSQSSAFPTCPPPSGSSDFIGKPAPTFAVDKWLSPRPNMEGKVIVVDFWATWCPPCRAAVPHMNELQAAFQSEVLCIGVTDETEGGVKDGLKKYKMKDSDFRYAMAIDPQRRMASALGIRGIPSVMVVSPDGVVRWQGHPSSLSTETLGAIVRASKGAAAPSGSSGAPPRWGVGKS